MPNDAINFHTQVRLSDWNSSAQCDVFFSRLAPYIKDELVSFDLPHSLDGRSHVDGRPPQPSLRNNISRRGQTYAGGPYQANTRGTGAATTGKSLSLMRPGWALCLPLPSKRKASAVTRGILLSQSQNFAPCPRAQFHAQLRFWTGIHTLATFIDSWDDVSLIGEELAVQLGINLIPLSGPLPASALDSHILGTITHQTMPIHMFLSGNHHETIQSRVLRSPDLPLILGYH